MTAPPPKTTQAERDAAAEAALLADADPALAAAVARAHATDGARVGVWRAPGGRIAAHVNATGGSAAALALLEELAATPGWRAYSPTTVVYDGPPQEGSSPP